MLHHMCDEVGGNGITFCGICGCYSQVKGKGLLLRCRGALKPKTPGWYVLQRLIKGLHPITGSPVGRPARGSRPTRAKSKCQRHASEPPSVSPMGRGSTEDDHDPFVEWSGSLAPAAPCLVDDLDFDSFDPGFDQDEFFGV